MVMAACPRGHIAACELQQELLSLSCRIARSASSFFLREVADPTVTQYLTVTGAQLTYPICYVFAFFYPCALSDVIVDSDLKYENKVCDLLCDGSSWAYQRISGSDLILMRVHWHTMTMHDSDRPHGHVWVCNGTSHRRAPRPRPRAAPVTPGPGATVTVPPVGLAPATE